jgi:bacillithiol biosynthesis cysteine-adding enzyme BshC
LTQKIAAGRVPARAVKSLSFAEIPGQSRLFLDYLKDSASLKSFYPNTAASPLQSAAFRDTLLRSYVTSRSSLCNALRDINKAGGAPDATLRNVELLQERDTVAIVTGQQAGLFSGPLYTIYKAMSAIRLADHLCNSGVNAVPVFWVASEDHDIEEIDHVEVLRRNGELSRQTYRPLNFTGGASVGDIQFDGRVEQAVDELMLALPQTEFSGEVRQMLATSYANGDAYGTSFTKLILALLGNYGLVVIDPLHAGIKKLASPMYVAAIERSEDIVTAIRQRNADLDAAGYTPQVLVEADYFPLFWHDESGRRLALRHTGDGMFRVKGEKRQLHRNELLQLAQNDPQRLSPGVMLRPIVQDYLLPTLCYFGGGAEIAYFAQNSAAYQVLDRPVTPVFHRQSFTVVEPRERRNLRHFGWDLKALFKGKDAALMDAAERELASDLARLFADVEGQVNDELNRLDQRLSRTDPTIAASLANRRKKILYHIKTLRDKALLSEVYKNETMRRRIDDIFNALLPHGVLQERELNMVTFLNNYGPGIIDWIYDAVDLNDRGHRILEI